jgi:hypothetical protein
MILIVEYALPSFLAGSKRIPFMAAIQFWVKPSGSV